MAIRLENIHERDELSSQARERNSRYEQTSVLTTKVPDYESDGWSIQGKRGKFKTRLRREKPISSYLEDRLWSILYKVGFTRLSGQGGAKLHLGDGVWNQLDAVAYDDASALIAECKSAEQVRSRDDLDKEMALLVQHRGNLQKWFRSQDAATKIRVGALLVLHDVDPSENDIQRAKEQRIVLLDATALEYYEKLVEHTGEAARYQLLAEAFADQEIDGLKMLLPAVQARMGKSVTYTFAISPSHLLRLTYVAHRNRGELGAAGSNAYQRLVKRTRLAKIREFVKKGGIFPTNIVVSFNPPRGRGVSGLRFEPRHQEDGAAANVKLGWLHLPARYQCAWIIDGQHRLLAYSGLEEAEKSFLSVTAFDCLDVTTQAELFTRINSEQKKVSGSLLTELYADLKWDSDDYEERVQSIVSKAIITSASRSTSPFYRRVLMADELATDTRCISLKAVADALTKNNFYLVRKQHGDWVEYGPLWAVKQDLTLRRTRVVLEGWFASIVEVAGEVWRAGKAEGGYLGMNMGVVVCILVLRSVLEHLADSGMNCNRCKNEELIDAIQPFGRLVGEYFATLTLHELHQFRRRLGNAGKAEARNLVHSAIHDQVPEFNPTGLQDFLSNQAHDKSEEAKVLVNSVEQAVRQQVVRMMMDRFGGEWWAEVPQSVQVRVAVERAQDNRSKGGEECYLGYKDLRRVILEHWQDFFQPVFAYGSTGNKTSRTEWLAELSSLQRKLATDGPGLELAEYNQLVSINSWLRGGMDVSSEDEFPT